MQLHVAYSVKKFQDNKIKFFIQFLVFFISITPEYPNGIYVINQFFQKRTVINKVRAFFSYRLIFFLLIVLLFNQLSLTLQEPPTMAARQRNLALYHLLQLPILVIRQTLNPTLAVQQLLRLNLKQPKLAKLQLQVQTLVSTVKRLADYGLTSANYQ